MSPGSSHAIPFRSVRRATFAQLFIATALRRPPNMDKLARGGNARNWESICRLFLSSNSDRIDNYGGVCLLFRRQCGLLFAVKPGRKLIDQGASSCTDAEILAIIFSSGGRGYRALDAAHEVLERYGTLSDLMDRPLDEIANIRGIKTVRAVRLAAAYELCQRLLKEIDRNA